MFRVSVTELCDFTAKQGDLDARFRPAPTSQEGMAGHLKLAARRRGGYEREIALRSLHGVLEIHGRADSYCAATNELEEFKTHRGKVERIAPNRRTLHWAQLKFYGYQLCLARELEDIQLTLVYFDIDRELETPFSESFTRDELGEFHAQHCAIFEAWALKQMAHRQALTQAISRLQFPFENFHDGQRRLAEGVFRASRQRQHLMAQAPTGIGKSVGTLFPAAKALGAGHLDRIFYLTAKTSGRRQALDAMASLKVDGKVLPARVLELVALEKSCELPDKACHGASCPLARGFYDRLPAAREAATRVPELDRGRLRSIALEHEICPYFLSQELARWADVVVGDYNYYFDQNALLLDLTVVNDWRVGVLVDEAHNLLERGRGMYTAALDRRHLGIAISHAPAGLKAVLRRIDVAWEAVTRDQEPSYMAYPGPPKSLVGTLQKAVSAMTKHFADHRIEDFPDLQQFYFDSLNFLGREEEFDDHSLFDVEFPEGAPSSASVLCIRNVVPAPFIGRRIRSASTVAAFSATLSPAAFYQEMLGFPAATSHLDVPSPFHPDQLKVHLVSRISTRYRHRARSVRPIADLIGQQMRREPGNYLAFFSSYAYQDQVAAAVKMRFPDIPIWSQTAGMSEAQRQEFLEQFRGDGRGVGFAVLGGVFSEGVDLPGDRLIGTFIATLGLPQVNPVNEEMRGRMEALCGAGFDYIYLYPGLQKVTQAAGRVVRSTSDRGSAFLIDDRFERPDVQKLLPTWWKLQGGVKADLR